MNNVGFIVYIKKHKEKSLIVKILTKNNIIIGYLNNGVNKYNYYKNQVGNFIYFSIIKHLDNSCPVIDTELINSNIDLYFSNKINLIMFNSAITLLNAFIKENEVMTNIYNTFYNLVFAIKNEHSELLLYLIDFLFVILNHLGININLEYCAITKQITDLYYISPKTGSCVIKEIGEQYKDNLFVIPQCFKTYSYKQEDLINAFTILFYFLNKFIDNNNLFYLKEQINFVKNDLLNYINHNL